MAGILDTLFRRIVGEPVPGTGAPAATPTDHEPLTTTTVAALRAMLDAAEAHGVPTVLLTVPSNLRDWHPNVSRHGVDGEVLDATADADLRRAHRPEPGAQRLLDRFAARTHSCWPHVLKINDAAGLGDGLTVV